MGNLKQANRKLLGHCHHPLKIKIMAGLERKRTGGAQANLDLAKQSRMEK